MQAPSRKLGQLRGIALRVATSTLLAAATLGCGGEAARAPITAPDQVTITRVMPDVGSIAGGTPITITGIGFRAGARVSVGGVLATAVLMNADGTLSATTPPHDAGSVDVTVANPDQRVGILRNAFRYHDQVDACPGCWDY